VDHHPGWLVDYDEVFILEEDVERDRLGYEREGGGASRSTSTRSPARSR
jgi:hypothetical protein